MVHDGSEGEGDEVSARAQGMDHGNERLQEEVVFRVRHAHSKFPVITLCLNLL